MSWSSKISAVIADVKAKLTDEGYTVVSNKEFVDGSRMNVFAVTVSSATFDNVYEVGEGRVEINVAYKHDLGTDEEIYTEIGEVEDIFESYQISGGVGIRLREVSNYYKARTQDKSVAVLLFEVIL